MAEINELVSKETLNNIRILEESLGKVVARLNQVAVAAEKTDKELIGLSNSRNTSQKAVNKSTTQAISLNKQLQNADDQAVKAKLRFAKATKDQKAELNALLVVEDKQAGTINRLIASNKLIEIEKRKLTSTGKKLRTETAAYNKQIDKNSKAIKSNRAASQGLTNTLKGLGRQILGAAGLAGGMTALFRIIKGGFATTFKFERQMSLVKSVSGATNDEFKKLRQSAISLGGSTAFTASEVAGLQKEYAKLGFTASQIVEVTAATLDLAAAAGEDLAQSATVAGATLKAFNLNAFEMQRVVDVMAKSFSSSALDLGKFQTAMQDIGPTSSAVNISLERSTANLSLLADRGLDASKAGTSLRNIYLELEKQGLSWDDAMTMINSSTNKATTALNLFGKRGAVAGLILADNTEEADEFTTAYENAAGAAKEMANINLDNVLGATTRLASAWEGLVLRTNNSEGALKRFLNTLTDVVSTINTKGKPAIDSMFEEKKIEKFGDKWKFYRDQGIGFSATLVSSLIRGKKKTQELADGLAEIGTEMEKQREAEQAGILSIETARKKANDEKIAQAEAAVEAADKAFKLFRKESEELSKGLTEIDIGRGAAIDTQLQGMELLKEAYQRDADAAIEAELLKQEVRKETWQLTADLINSVTDLSAAFGDRELQKAESRKNMELSMAGDNEKQREIIEEKFAKKKAEIQRKQAIADKIAALFNIGLNTAIGITNALSKVLTIPLIPFIAGLGAVQAAAVIASPIPQFAKGTSKSPDTFIAGEKGRELMIDPTGHMMMANSPTMFTGMKGTKIISNKETETMIGAALTLRSNSQIEGAIREGNREIIDTIRNKKEITIFASKNKIVERTGRYFKTYENAKITG